MPKWTPLHGFAYDAFFPTSPCRRTCVRKTEDGSGTPPEGAQRGAKAHAQGDIRPEGWAQRRRGRHALITALKPFAVPVSEGRQVRTCEGGRRRVRAWTLPDAVYTLAAPISPLQAKKSRTGLTLLHAAIALGDACATDWLLRAGFPTGQYAGGRPLMGFAYFDDRPRAVRLLWQHGATHEHVFRSMPDMPKWLLGATQFHRLLERGARGLDTEEEADAQRLRDRCAIARFYAATYEHPLARNEQGLTAFDLAPRGDVVAEAAHAVVAARQAEALNADLPEGTNAATAPLRSRM